MLIAAAEVFAGRPNPFLACTWAVLDGGVAEAFVPFVGAQQDG
jgi:hypothetical protein